MYAAKEWVCWKPNMEWAAVQISSTELTNASTDATLNWLHISMGKHNITVNTFLLYILNISTMLMWA